MPRLTRRPPPLGPGSRLCAAGQCTARAAKAAWDDAVTQPLSPQLLEAINQGSQGRRQRRQAERLKPYIAAQMDLLPETFTLGDEKNYKGFYNKPLSEDLSYRCFVLASLEDGDTVRAACRAGDQGLAQGAGLGAWEVALAAESHEAEGLVSARRGSHWNRLDGWCFRRGTACVSAITDERRGWH